jgi:hypothetical protein
MILSNHGFSTQVRRCSRMNRFHPTDCDYVYSMAMMSPDCMKRIFHAQYLVDRNACPGVASAGLEIQHDCRAGRSQDVLPAPDWTVLLKNAKDNAGYKQPLFPSMDVQLPGVHRSCRLHRTKDSRDQCWNYNLKGDGNRWSH